MHEPFCRFVCIQERSSCKSICSEITIRVKHLNDLLIKKVQKEFWLKVTFEKPIVLMVMINSLNMPSAVVNSELKGHFKLNVDLFLTNSAGSIDVLLWWLKYCDSERLVYGWQKILENIMCGYGHHEWKYWIYHEWPQATSDKSNIFTSDDQNHE